MLCQVEAGRVTLNVDVNSIYTLTTLNTGRKGDAGKIPSPADFPLPYRDDFDGSLVLKYSFGHYVYTYFCVFLCDCVFHVCSYCNRYFTSFSLMMTVTHTYLLTYYNSLRGHLKATFAARPKSWRPPGADRRAPQ